jgi:hypothetical protein
VEQVRAKERDTKNANSIFEVSEVSTGEGTDDDTNKEDGDCKLERKLVRKELNFETITEVSNTYIFLHGENEI